MASSRGRLPYPLQQESKINTSWYHKEDNSGKPICGSNTHALAQIIQTLIQNKKFLFPLIAAHGNTTIVWKKNSLLKKNFTAPSLRELIFQKLTILKTFKCFSMFLEIL